VNVNRLVVALVLLLPGAALALPGDPTPRMSSTPFSPDASRYAIYARWSGLWVTDPRFDLVGETDAMPRIEAGFGWVPGWAGDALALEAGYGYGEIEAPVFDFGDAGLDFHSIQAAAIYRRNTTAQTRAFVRGQLSLDFALLHVDGDGQGTDLQDLAVIPGLEGTIGWELLLPMGQGRTDDDRPLKHLAMGIEAGYAYRPLEAEFALDRELEGGDGPKPIERVAADLGGIDLSGWVLRLGMALRF
jgi:hypothetical protein